MAKLNGVKTLDMTNGEITKVEYNGAIYEKVDGKAQVGDIAIAKKDVRGIGMGEFAKVDGVDYVGDPSIEPHGPYFAHVFEFLRAEQASSSEYRLITDRGPKAGDFVKYAHAPFSYVTAGKYYEITEIDFTDDPQIIDDDGDYYDTSGDNFEVYEKASGVTATTITHNGATYTLVDRKAQPGDVVVFTENTSDAFDNGKSYGPAFINEGALRVIDNDGDDFNIYRVEFNRTPANVKVYAPVSAPLKVGDYAKVVQSGHSNFGKIVKIISDNYSQFYPFDTELLDGEEADCHRTDHLVKATDEEVDAAKAEVAKQSEAKRWASINRKPNEFKHGDIVRVTVGYNEIKNGDVGEITHADGSECPGVTVRGIQRYCYVDLITPVEHRFDLQSKGDHAGANA